MEIPKYIIKIVLDINESQETSSLKRLGRKIQREVYIMSNELPVIKDGFVRVKLSVFNKDKFIYYRVYTNVEEIAKQWFYRYNPKLAEFDMDFNSCGNLDVKSMIESYEG